MSTKSKAKGTTAEREVVKYLRNWWPAAERRALSGNEDKGDVAGIPGVVVEVKAAAMQRLAEWQRETLVEMGNAQALGCMLVVKRPYKPVHQWDAYLPSRHVTVSLPNTFGRAEWLRMDLCLAVAVIKDQGLGSPSGPSLSTTESS